VGRRDPRCAQPLLEINALRILGEFLLQYFQRLFALPERFLDLAFRLEYPADLNMHAGDVVLYVAAMRLRRRFGVSLKGLLKRTSPLLAQAGLVLQPAKLELHG